MEPFQENSDPSPVFMRNLPITPGYGEADHNKKPLQEPPIPGWAGYIPRARVTELGYAVRHHVMAKQSYEDFLNMIETHKKGPLKHYQSLMGDKPFKTSHVPPKFCPEFKPKDQYEDSTRRPCGGGYGSSSLYAFPTLYRGPCRPGKYLEPLPCRNYIGG